MVSPPAPSPKSEKETGRVEAFSDGVFAIAITLVALELKVPHSPAEGSQSTATALAASLSSEWPSYFAFVTSFFTVLIMWVHHHVIFRLVHCTDALLLFANGLLLLFVTVVRFSTAIVAEYLATPAASTARLVYAGTFVLIAISFYLLLMAAFRTSTLDPDAHAATVLRLRRDYRFGPPAYLLATLAAPFSPWAAMLICTALWVFWAATTREC